MRKKLIESTNTGTPGYGAGSGNIERYEYECLCGKGKIVEQHDNIPGFRESDVWIDCKECQRKYVIDTSKGLRNWELVEKS